MQSHIYKSKFKLILNLCTVGSSYGQHRSQLIMNFLFTIKFRHTPDIGPCVATATYMDIKYSIY
jgi:hypothetical protein